jgi:hypothetical protein
VHGSTKAMGTRAANRAMGRGNAAAKLAGASFTADMSAKTGKPKRPIQSDATCAKALASTPPWTRAPTGRAGGDAGSTPRNGALEF